MMRFVSYGSFVLLCGNQRDNSRISEFESSCGQLIASCEWACPHNQTLLTISARWCSFDNAEIWSPN